MSGLRIIDVEQGTDEWLEARRGMITASTVGQLVTPRTIQPAANPESRALVARLAAERITGWVDDGGMSTDMWRGVEDEPRARDLYGEHYAPVTECGLMVRDLDDGAPLGYSPDGLVGDVGLIEVKSRKPGKHIQTVVADQVPAEYMAQIQAGLLVSGRAWCDYISYSGGLPLWIVRVYPDERWRSAIVAAVGAAEQTIADTAACFAALTAGLPMTERTTYDLGEMTL